MSSTVVGMDGVLVYIGNSHPCLKMQLLLATGMLALGTGSNEASTLLPVPLYGCWLGLSPSDFNNECEGFSLLPAAPRDRYRQVLECGESKWSPLSFPGFVILIARMVVTLVAGLCFDLVGRRRSIIVWMGLYFVVALARAFSPNSESISLCVTLEGAASQAATLGLILLAGEGSTQGECVRTVCLMLLGHAIGMGAIAPVITTYTQPRYQQIYRSLFSLVFVLYIFTLPGSARWAVCRGHIQEATVTLKKSHHMAFDPNMKHKLTALHQEHKSSLMELRCSGHPLRESVIPLVRSGRLFLSMIVFIICGLVMGSAASARNLYDPTSYNSYEDRQVAFGIIVSVGLLLVGLLMTKLDVKCTLVALFSTLSMALLLTRVLYHTGWWDCSGFVFFSCLGHSAVVLTSVWTTVGVIRLTPTHSRGLILGITYSLSILGYIIPYFDYLSLFASYGMYLDTYAELGIWAILTFLAGLLVLLLPKTPSSLPDILTHLKSTCYQEEKAESEGLQNTEV